MRQNKVRKWVKQHNRDLVFWFPVLAYNLCAFPVVIWLGDWRMVAGCLVFSGVVGLLVLTVYDLKRGSE